MVTCGTWHSKANNIISFQTDAFGCKIWGVLNGVNIWSKLSVCANVLLKHYTYTFTALDYMITMSINNICVISVVHIPHLTNTQYALSVTLKKKSECWFFTAPVLARQWVKRWLVIKYMSSFLQYKVRSSNKIPNVTSIQYALSVTLKKGSERWYLCYRSCVRETIFIRVTCQEVSTQFTHFLQALGQSHYCPIASNATIKNMDT